MAKTQSLFKGEFLVDTKTFRRRLKDVKAFVFDWDGVFNNGHKTESGSSSFSEIDSLGANLLRFSHYLVHGALPFAAIISGEHNKAAAAFAEREHFHAIYSGIKHKVEALQHFCKSSGITATETAFVFDDLLDLSAAAVCGLRIMVTRPANPLLIRYVRKNKLADYFTFSGGASGAVREAAELMMHFHGRYDEMAGHRISYSKEYKTYLELRNSVKTKQVTAKELAILSAS